MKSQSFLSESSDRRYQILAEKKYLKAELHAVNEDLRQLDDILPAIAAGGAMLGRGALALGGTALRGLGTAATAVGRGIGTAATAAGRGIVKAAPVVGRGIVKGAQAAVRGASNLAGQAAGSFQSGLAKSMAKSATSAAGQNDKEQGTFASEKEIQQMKQNLEVRKKEIQDQIKALQQELTMLARGA